MNTNTMELNLNEMSNAAGGSNIQLNKAAKKTRRCLHDLFTDIYKNLFVPTKTLD